MAGSEIPMTVNLALFLEVSYFSIYLMASVIISKNEKDIQMLKNSIVSRRI